MKPNALCCPGWASVTMPATSGEAMLVPPPVSLVNFALVLFGHDAFRPGTDRAAALSTPPVPTARLLCRMVRRLLRVARVSVRGRLMHT